MNKNQAIWSAFMLLMILGSCKGPDENNARNLPILNLVGTWESTGNTIFYESWESSPDSGLTGYAYSIGQNGDTMFSVEASDCYRFTTACIIRRKYTGRIKAGSSGLPW